MRLSNRARSSYHPGPVAVQRGLVGARSQALSAIVGVGFSATVGRLHNCIQSSGERLDEYYESPTYSPFAMNR